ncbi:MAG: elongation factor Ts [bacterium]|nr:elongation factor Ts [bacterium]
MIDTVKIKMLREQTGISFAQCKEALESGAGDIDKALSWLKEKGAAVAQKKAGRELHAGTVAAYIHQGVIGTLVLLHSETDFVSKNPDFKSLADDLAMQVAATDPADVSALLLEPFIKDPAQTVGDLIQTAVQKFGERVELARFIRFSL